MLYSLIHAPYILTSRGMSCYGGIAAVYSVHSFALCWLCHILSYYCADNIILQLTSRIFVVQVQTVKIYIILDPSIKAASFPISSALLL
ncbi:hypothetical protein Gohar_012492, partial [Gossypium harknessii]|nr:hypothetical protein [Gossypium harknessii]